MNALLIGTHEVIAVTALLRGASWEETQALVGDDSLQAVLHRIRVRSDMALPSLAVQAVVDGQVAAPSPETITPTRALSDEEGRVARTWIRHGWKPDMAGVEPVVFSDVFRAIHRVLGVPLHAHGITLAGALLAAGVLPEPDDAP
ncbi:hypothetical protein ACN20G_33595 (plasmid) [Streptomyces sp. BI20]|uniref:hypothetical protein n=1 Tax=Streptomyces sp. BI20 TaxID=3403460 RepID=UPI003C75A3D2